MQTIQTKYFGPTNYLGSRIKATTESGISTTISYPYELSGVDCHIKAVNALNKKLGWSGDMIIGGLKQGFVFTFENDNRMTLKEIL
jgi:hypothetical protein